MGDSQYYAKSSSLSGSRADGIIDVLQLRIKKQIKGVNLSFDHKIDLHTYTKQLIQESLTKLEILETASTLKKEIYEPKNVINSKSNQKSKSNQVYFDSNQSKDIDLDIVCVDKNYYIGNQSDLIKNNPNQNDKKDKSNEFNELNELSELNESSVSNEFKSYDNGEKNLGEKIKGNESKAKLKQQDKSIKGINVNQGGGSNNNVNKDLEQKVCNNEIEDGNVKQDGSNKGANIQPGSGKKNTVVSDKKDIVTPNKLNLNEVDLGDQVSDNKLGTVINESDIFASEKLKINFYAQSDIKGKSINTDRQEKRDALNTESSTKNII